MKKINPLLLTSLMLLGWGTMYGQQTLLRKDLKKQNERTARYSRKPVVFTDLMQVGVLVRTAQNDSLNTAQGLNSWQYGAGFGWVIPVVGPVWLRLEADYRYRNYRMQKDDDAILGQAERLQRYKMATHAAEFGLNLRISSTQGGLNQGKYVELGYVYGRNFASRMIYHQGIDPALNLGAGSAKIKLRNPDFIAPSSHYAQVIVGKEALAIFGQYRLSEMFERSKNVYNNQQLPELSRLTLGIAFMIANDPPGGNTDENDAPSH